MTAALEPVLAGGFEEAFADGEPLVAFPRGRGAELAARRPGVTFVAVVDGPAMALDELDLPGDARTEVVLVDNASPAFAECLRYVASEPNRVLYRLPRRIPRARAWQLARALAHGAETSDAVPETRELAVLVAGWELVADPALLAAWRAALGPEAPASLVAVVAPSEVDGLVRAVEAAEADGDTGDVVAVVAPDVERELARLQPLCRGTLSRLPRAGAWIRPDELGALR
jgi:hypothetical protein